jgi:hypothetical protein
VDGAVVRHAGRFGIGVMALLAWGVLSFGAVYPWAYWPLFVAGAGLGLWGIVAGRAWHDPRIRWIGAALGAVVLAMVVQIVALPAWLIAWASPGVDRFFRQFELGYHPASLHAFSLAPATTAVNAAEVLAFGLLLLGGARAIRYVRLDWLVSQMMGLGVAIAVIGIVQKALGPPDHARVYGFWQPHQGGNPFGPFINRNHFAGWMVMVLPIVAAYAWALVQQEAARPGERAGGWMRWAGSVEGNRVGLVAIAALIMGVALVFTGSRSGIASFAVAMGVLALFVLGPGQPRRGRWVAVAYLLLMAGVAVAWAGSDLLVARFQRAPQELGGRVSAWRDSMRIVSDFPIFGAGIGGYRQAMLVYQTSGRELMYAEAHNDYLQLAAEGGLLVGVPALTLLLVVGAGIRRRLRAGGDDVAAHWVRRGAVAGLAAIAAQSLVEFSLQMPGNAVLFVLLLALALHRPRTLNHAYRV